MGIVGFQPGTPVGWNEQTQKLVPPTGQALDIRIAYPRSEAPEKQRDPEDSKAQKKDPTNNNKPDNKRTEQPSEKRTDNQSDNGTDNRDEKRSAKRNDERTDERTGKHPEKHDDTMPIERWLQTSDGDPVDDIHWVFAGSRILDDNRLGAEADGTIICVVDFDTALIAVGQLHSASNDALWLMANPKTIPPVGTPCSLIIRLAE